MPNQRDDYRNRRGKQKSDGLDFICSACHVGFALSRSPRVEYADSLQREMRSQRPPNFEVTADEPIAPTDTGKRHIECPNPTRSTAATPPGRKPK